MAHARRRIVEALPDEPITVRLPPPHEHQRIFMTWDEDHPAAQCLVAPCGTKTGKSFGAALWMARENLNGERLYSAWVAPTLFKARIGYRYLLHMLPDCGLIDESEAKGYIGLANGCTINFLHGQNAETTIEGEAVDRFVLDEAGKLKKQVWYSLLTTLTQTGGKGIVTGTPRGFTWYRDIFLKAQGGDPFFVWCQLKTGMSPYVLKAALEKAKRLLPPWLFAQYYEAVFVSMSTVFGSLDHVWDVALAFDPHSSYWLHPSVEARRGQAVCVGVDWAKKKDWTVFTAVNAKGQLVGYYRFRGVGYPAQVRRLRKFIAKFSQDVMIRHDATGVGEALDDLLDEANLDADITAVYFTNQSKAEMVTKVIVAVEEGWFTAPRLPVLERELNAYEVQVTRSGLMSFSAPAGEHDDVVSSLLLAISGAYVDAAAAEAEGMLEGDTLSKGKPTSPGQPDADGSDLDELADALAGDGGDGGDELEDDGDGDAADDPDPESD